MAGKGDRSRTAGFFKASLFILFIGGFFGGTEALLSLGEMKTTISYSPWLSIPYRFFIGASFYAQVFLALWLGIFVTAQLISRFSKTASIISIEKLALSTSIISALSLPGWVILNKWLPSFRSVESILGNLFFPLTALIFVFLIGRLFSKNNLNRKEKRKGGAFLFLFVEVIFLVVLVFSFNSGSLPGSAPSTGDTDKPNILLITIDTLRADHLSAYGYQGISTPNMDRIGKEGVLFENAISPTSWTLPALSTLMTGVPEQVHGMNRHDVALDPAFETLAEVLKREGYLTTAVVTNEFVNHPYGLDKGFDLYLFSRDALAYHPFSGLFLFDFLFAWRNERHSCRVMTDRAIEVLNKSKDRRFFMWIHYIDPHTPYGAWYINRFPKYDSGYAGSMGKEFNDIDGIDKGTLKLSDEDKKHILALYDAEIMYVDDHIGRLFGAMDDLGLMENTAIILSSDHGEEFWDHGGVVHGRKLYKESVHVPLMIRYPKMFLPGKRVTSTTGIENIPLTICDIAGVDCPDNYIGSSLVSWSEKTSEPGMTFVSLDKLNPDGKAFLALGLYSDHAVYLNHISPEGGESLFDPITGRLITKDEDIDFDKYRLDVDNYIQKYLNIKAGIKFKNEGGKIILTPDMTDALKGLGYVN